ncbi:tetratricopeptide repeat protein, partial [Pedobacter sp.]
LILQQALLPVANLLSKYNEVVVAGEKLIKNGTDANVVRVVAKAYFYLKNYEMAAAYAKRTIAEGISPNTSAYYNMLGGIYDEKQQLTAAITAYKKGLSYDRNKNIQYRLGLLYDLKLKQSKTALSYYNQFLKNTALNEEDKPQIAYIKARIEEFKKK